MRSQVKLTVLVGAVLASATFIGCSKKQEVVLPPMKVNVVKAVQTDVPMYEEFVAQVYGSSDVTIRTRVEGWVTSVNFKEGSMVKKGALLYVVDDVEYKNRLDQKSSELTQAKTELVRSQTELSRVKPLTELKALSQKDLDNAQAAYDAAVAHVAAVQSSLENAKVELGYTRVSAPFDGIVGISNVREGEYVSRAGSSSVLTTISSVDGVRVRFQISEREYLRIAKLTTEEIQSAKKNVHLILADGTTYDQKGEVNFADREIDPKTGTLTIEASFPNPTGILRPGLFVKARLLLSTYPNAVMVPQRAVFQLQHLSQVYLLTDSSTLKASSVVPGPKVGDGWIITKGLKPGDKVAIIGNASLTPNTKVESIDTKWPEEVQQ